MPWASSEESGGQDQALTSGEAGQLKSNLEGVEQSAQGLTLHETQDIRQIESQVRPTRRITPHSTADAACWAWC
jgi:hypothetical protein